ncbi:MAG: FxsA family protein [Verrucomicrobiales bacterium]|nr:FxsA family protein [Verrucomicrobiales bacterium]
MFFRLLLLFIFVPLIELILFYQIGTKIGIGWTVATVVVTGFLGAWLTKLQGLKTLSKFRQATAEGRMPHAEIMDGLMILVAGAVLLTPGFLTDAIGFCLLVPPIRALVRKSLGHHLKARVQVTGVMPDAQKPATEGRREDPVIIEAEAEVMEDR